MSRPVSASTTPRPMSSRAQRVSAQGSTLGVPSPRPPTTSGTSSDSARTPRPPTLKAYGTPQGAMRRNERPVGSRRDDESERQEALDHIAAFETLLSNHLVHTLPSSQKQRCTEHVVDATTAVAKAAAAVHDMHAIGLSGLRLTGDFEHEYQFPRAAQPLVPSAHRARGQVSLGHVSGTVRASGLVGPTRTSTTEAIATLAPEGTHTRGQLLQYPVPSLEELRLPLGQTLQAGVATAGASARCAAQLGCASTTPRPVSARVYPPVSQVRMFTAPLYPDIPIAPHLTAVMKWCRNADRLCKDRYLRHCLVIAAQTTEDADHQFQRHVAWSDGGGGFVAAAVVPPPQVGKHKPMASIIRESRFAVRMLHEATHGMFEDHLNRYNALVAVWFEYCNKDVTTPKTQYRIPGCMGNSESKFTAFFETVFESVFTGPRDSEALYKLLNDNCLEQLTFGRCFFVLYLVLSIQTNGRHGEAPQSNATGAHVDHRRRGHPRPSMVGADIALNNTLFAATVVSELTPFTRPTAAGESSSSRPATTTATAKLCELWFSWAGLTLNRTCRTINAFHLESIVATVIGLFDPENGELPALSTRPVDLKQVTEDLNDDIASFRHALGTRIEVMLEDGLEILQQHTKILGKWLTSSSATDAQDELNAMAEHVIRSIEEEDRAERQRDAMRQALVAASPPPRKKRALGRSSSLSMPRRKPSDTTALPRKMSLI